MREKTVIIYKNGEVKKIKSNVGRTRHNKAAYQLRKNNVQPFARQRFIWLIKNLKSSTKKYVAKHYRQPDAAAIPPIGLLEEKANGNMF